MCFLWGQWVFALLDPSLDVNQYAHTAWTTRDAFFKSTVVAIAQTPDGYLWLGTKVGLLRFDGVRSSQWTPPGGEHLPSSSIVSLLAARDGTLWIGTDAGVASWNGREVKRYRELDRQRVLTLLEDREGTIWIGGQANPTSRLCAVRTGLVRCWGQDGALGTSVFSLYQDSKGSLWVGAASGLWRWNPGPEKVYVMPHTVPPLQLNDLNESGDGRLLIALRGGVRQFVNGKAGRYLIPDVPKPYSARRLLRDRSGSLWIGTIDRGLLHVHHGRTDVFSRSDGLSGEIVQSILEDREGNIWIVTNGGIDRFREYAVFSFSSQQGLSTDAGGSVLAARDGSVWIGTFHDLNRWDHGKVTVFNKKNGLPDNKPQAQYEDYRGRIWVFTSRGLALFDNGKFTQIPGVPGGNVHSIAGDSADNLWLAEDRSLLHLRSMKLVEQIPWSQLGQEVPANQLVNDQEHGGLWLGFATAARVAYLENGKIRASYSAADRLGKDTVTSLNLGKKGSLWAGTKGGLSLVRDGRIATLTSNDGLPCDAVDWVIEDDNGSVWLQMPCGLLRIDVAELEACIGDKSRKIRPTIFDGSDGFFPRSDPLATYSPRVSKAPDGKLWFLSSGGISAIDPNHVPFNNLSPPVYIERVIADDKPYNVSNGMHLPPRVHSVMIDYTALSLVVPEKVRFRVKLEGLDSDWQDVGNRRQAFYTNLPPRRYRFRLIACNNSGVWNEEGASLDFAIDPAYNQTNWFRALCGLTFLAMLWTVYQLRVNALKWRQAALEQHQALLERNQALLQQNQALLEQHQVEISALNEQLIKGQEAERMRISGELHDGVLQQITSLTLNLGKVKRQVPPDSEAKATINGLQQQLITIGTDIRHLSHELHPVLLQEAGLPVALSSYCEEFSKARGLLVSCETEESVEQLSPGAALCLYRIAQEALGNAAKYSEAMKVEVRLTRADARVSLSVSDDGVGCAPDQIGKTGGLGVINMRERVLQLNGTFEFDSEPGRGTTVRVEIPFQTES